MIVEDVPSWSAKVTSMNPDPVPDLVEVTESGGETVSSLFNTELGI